MRACYQRVTFTAGCSMTMSAAAPMHSEPVRDELRTCPYYRNLFRPRTPWQAFCSSKHRTAYDVEFGAIGVVANVRKLRKGVSVVIHLDGPAAERALRFGLRDPVRLVGKP